MVKVFLVGFVLSLILVEDISAANDSRPRGLLDSAGGTAVSERFRLGRGSLGQPFETMSRFSEQYTVLTGFLHLRPETAAILKGDFNGDRVVDFLDFAAFAMGFGRSRGEAEFDQRLDLDRDDEVGFGDFLIFVIAFGTSAP